MEAGAKRKHIVLTIEKKIEIINRLAMGETGSSLARIYGIGKTTISNIKSKTEDLLEYATKLDMQGGSKKRKTMKCGSHKSLENAVYAWYCQCRAEGITVSGPQLCEKALDINREQGGSSDFKASTGWLQKFKLRHGIRLQGGGSESAVSDDVKDSLEDDSSSSQNILFDILKQDGFTKDNIYHIEMARLNWNSLPNYSDVPTKNDKLTYVICANVSGNHVLPLLVIGSIKNPRCLQKVVTLSAAYLSQKQAMLDGEVLREWYTKHFIPSVKKQHDFFSNEGKVLLLMESTTGEMFADQLNNVDENFKVMFLSSNLISHVEPFYEHVIGKVTKLYKKLLLGRVLMNPGTLETFLDTYSLKDCCYALTEAWELTREVRLSNAWKNIYGGAKDLPQVEPTEEQWLNELKELLESIPEYQGCSVDDIQTWLANRTDDIISPDNSLEESDSDVDVCDIKEEEEETSTCPSHEEAIASLETAMLWFEQQTDCHQSQLMQLKKLKDLAVKKLKPLEVQEKIDKYFT